MIKKIVSAHASLTVLSLQEKGHLISNAFVLGTKPLGLHPSQAHLGFIKSQKSVTLLLFHILLSLFVHVLNPIYMIQR